MVINTNMYFIRSNLKEHNQELVEFILKCWQKSYVNILDEDLLRNLPKEKFLNSRDVILNCSTCSCINVINEQGDIIGFCDAGKSWQNSATDQIGEIFAIYVDPHYQGLNIGSQLFEKQIFFKRKWV